MARRCHSTDDAGFLDCAWSLPTRDIHNVSSRAESASDYMVHRFPSNLRRHHEPLTAFPAGLLVLGGAICSFNPIRGQGMASATLQATELDGVLVAARSAGRLDGLRRSFFRRAVRVVGIAWDVTAGADVSLPESAGKRPALVDTIPRYVRQVQIASSQDAEVFRALLYVMNGQKAPPSIFAAAVARRVIRAAWKRRRFAPRSRRCRCGEGSQWWDARALGRTT